MCMDREQLENRRVVPFTTGSALRDLDLEITLIRTQLAQIDPASSNPFDQLAIPIFERMIARRQRLKLNQAA